MRAVEMKTRAGDSLAASADAGKQADSELTTYQNDSTLTTEQADALNCAYGVLRGIAERARMDRGGNYD